MFGHLPPDSDGDDDVIVTSRLLTFDSSDATLVDVYKLQLFDGDRFVSVFLKKKTRKNDRLDLFSFVSF